MELPTLDKFPKSVLASVDIQRAFIVSRLVVTAERLQVFRLLHGKRMKADAIGRALKVHKFYRKTFLDALVSLRLLRKAKDTYWNAPLAEKYFIDERSIYWTRQYSKECLQAYEALTVLEKVLTSGRSFQSIKRLNQPSYTEAMRRNRRQAEDFTQMLFHFHRDDAEALANYLDLSERRSVLDVGGGSGVMSIALAKKNPHLHAAILDIAPVCEIAAGNIRRAGLSRRVRALAGDIRHRLPAGYDVMMFCDIGPVSKQILINAYKSLPANGLIVIVDRYLSRDGTQPLDRLVAQFVGSSFPQATWADMVEAVKSCGFRAIKASNVYRDLWFITAIKPAPARGRAGYGTITPR
jgi:predicted O-methyltransferase YrrM